MKHEQLMQDVLRLGNGLTKKKAACIASRYLEILKIKRMAHIEIYEKEDSIIISWPNGGANIKLFDYTEELKQDENGKYFWQPIKKENIFNNQILKPLLLS